MENHIFGHQLINYTKCYDVEKWNTFWHFKMRHPVFTMCVDIQIFKENIFQASPIFWFGPISLFKYQSISKEYSQASGLHVPFLAIRFTEVYGLLVLWVNSSCIFQQSYQKFIKILSENYQITLKILINLLGLKMQMSSPIVSQDILLVFKKICHYCH